MANVVKDGIGAVTGGVDAAQDAAQDFVQGVFTPSSTKGYQEDMDKLEYYDAKKFAIEEARRNDTNPDNINFVFCLVFQAKEEIAGGMMSTVKGLCTKVPIITVEELDKERHRILERIVAAGFVTQSVFNATKDKIIVKVGCNDARLLHEAELREHKLELNPFSLQHVLELKVKEGDPDSVVDKPKHPIYLGYEGYDSKDFEKIQGFGGEDTLPLFRKREFLSSALTKEGISLDDAKSTFKAQCKADPFKYIHFKYDKDWEKKIIDEHKVQLYRVYRDGTILRTVDRIDLVQSALKRDVASIGGFKGAGLDLKNLCFDGKIKAYFPLEFSNQIMQAKDLNSGDVYQRFKTKFFGIGFFLPFKQPIQDVRDFCGEQVAYYFAFLEFYSLWLAFSALLGFIVFMIQLGAINEQTGAGLAGLLAPSEIINLSLPIEVAQGGRELIQEFVLQQDFTTERTPFAVDTAKSEVLFILTPTEVSLVLPIYAVLIALWGGFFLEFWKRREATLAFKWGVSDYEDTAEVRPEFKSQYDVPDAVTALPTPYRSKFGFAARLTFSFTTIATLVVVTIAAFTATYVFRVVMSKDDIGLDPAIATQVALVVNAVVIIGLATVFKSVGRTLTNWENHRTDIEYEDQLILKTFIFSFFNSYTTLIYFAFIKSGQTLLGQNQYCVAELQEIEAPNSTVQIEGLYEDKELFKVDSCYGALGYSLIIIFVLQIFVNNAQEVGIPTVKAFVKKKLSFRAFNKSTSTLANVVKGGNGEEKVDDPSSNKIVDPTVALRSPAETQFLLDAYETPFFDYLELALQFGYVTLFVASFPLAPLLALLNNFVEVWVDAQKVFILSRRPNAHRAQDIGSWYRIFEVLSYIAIVTNAGVLVFTSVEIIPVPSDRPEDRVWAFLAFILAIFAIKYLVDLFVPDVPEDISIMLKRQKFYEQKIFYDDEDDTDNIVVKVDKTDELSKDELAEKEMELHRKYEPVEVDPYMKQIVEEVRGNLRSSGISPDDLFKKIDTGKTNFISLKELKVALEDPELGIGDKVNNDIIQLFVKALDIDGDGKITKEELTAFIADTPSAEDV